MSDEVEINKQMVNNVAIEGVFYGLCEVLTNSEIIKVKEVAGKRIKSSKLTEEEKDMARDQVEEMLKRI